MRVKPSDYPGFEPAGYGRVPGMMWYVKAYCRRSDFVRARRVKYIVDRATGMMIRLNPMIRSSVVLAKSVARRAARRRTRGGAGRERAVRG